MWQADKPQRGFLRESTFEAVKFFSASERGPDGRPQPARIHRYYCGGFHLFQAVQRLHGAELPPALAEQYQLLLLRIKLGTDANIVVGTDINKEKISSVNEDPASECDNEDSIAEENLCYLIVLQPE